MMVTLDEAGALAEAFGPLIRKAQAEAWDGALWSCNDYSGDAPNPFADAARIARGES